MVVGFVFSYFRVRIVGIIEFIVLIGFVFVFVERIFWYMFREVWTGWGWGFGGSY